MREDAVAATYRCPSCGFFRSFFPVRINEVSHIDEDAREVALKPLRMSSFQTILDDIARDVPPPASVLDVGSAHGWFMEEAERRGYTVTGIEPDAEIAARAKGNVLCGYFPDAAQGQYDLIIFNDVFEHLPEPAKMMRAIADRLTPNGRAIINLPVSDGLIFKITRLAARLGMRGPLERMWQKGLPSPHLSYFRGSNLKHLAGVNGLTFIRCGRLESIVLHGLWQRIRADRSVSVLRGCAIYVAALVLFALSRFGSSDINYFVFKRHFGRCSQS